MKNVTNHLSDPDHVKILFLRKSLNITQKEMAALLDIEQSLLSKYERGERELPRKHLIRYCALFNIEVFQFNDCDAIDILVNFVIMKHGLVCNSFRNSAQLYPDERSKVNQQRIIISNEIGTQKKLLRKF